MSLRISLTEASRQAPQMLERGDSQLLEDGAAPTLADLAGALQFALGDGRIWLNDARMVMVQTEVLGGLRASIINALGPERARQIFMKAGWLHGVKSANLVEKRFKHDNLTAALAAGPRVHTIEGFAKVTTKRFEFDVAKQYYHGEFLWHDSAEGIEHVHNFGHSRDPVCWMQVGVPSGYTSALVGFPVIFREIECIGQGAERCVIIGKNADAWGDDLEETEIFGIARPKGKKHQPWTPPIDMIKAEKPTNANDIVGRSTGLVRARRLMERVAPLSEPVLLLGETGTGKEHFARRLHQLGSTPNGPFVRVNCSAFEDASTQADQSIFGKGGLAEQAHGGSLFLNDVLSLPAAMQARLSMLLQSIKVKNPPFRLLSAAGEQPMEAVAAGRLRADLHYDLSLLPIVIPPLRDRRDDLPSLIEHFLRLHSTRHKRPQAELSGPALDMLLRYDFPGNVRELSNMIERGLIYAEPGANIEISNIFTGIETIPQYAGQMRREGDVYRPKTIVEVRGERTMQDIEIDTYVATLDEFDWNISAAARKLGMSRAQLDYRISKYKLR